jgi:hypothetical protein
MALALPLPMLGWEDSKEGLDPRCWAARWNWGQAGSTKKESRGLLLLLLISSGELPAPMLTCTGVQQERE